MEVPVLVSRLAFLAPLVEKADFGFVFSDLVDGGLIDDWVIVAVYMCQVGCPEFAQRCPHSF